MFRLNHGTLSVVCAWAGDITNAKGMTVAIPIAMASMLHRISFFSIFIWFFTALPTSKALNNAPRRTKKFLTVLKENSGENQRFSLA